MGGSSSSRSEQTTNTENYNIQGSEGPVVTGDGNTVNVTDGGAFTFAGDVVAGLFETVQGMQNDQAVYNNENMKLITQQSKDAMDIAERASRSDQSAAISDMTRNATIAIGVIAVAAAVAYSAKKGKK